MWSRDFECASYSWGDGTSLVSGWSFHFARYKCFLVPGKSRSYFTQYWPNELSRWALSNYRYSCLPLFYCKLSSKKSAIDRFLCITVSKHQQEWWMIRKYGYSTMNTDRGSSFVIYLLASLRELQRNCYREGGRRDTKWPQRSRYVSSLRVTGLLTSFLGIRKATEWYNSHLKLNWPPVCSQGPPKVPTVVLMTEDAAKHFGGWYVLSFPSSSLVLLERTGTSSEGDLTK